MPKSRKQMTGVKKRNKPSPRRKKINKNVPVIPLLESATGVKLAHEPEMQQVDTGIEYSEIEIEDLADVSEERASIISIVKDLEGQVDTAYELKEILETELDATKKRLSEELVAHTQ